MVRIYEDRLKMAMARSRLTAGELEQKSGVAHSTVHRISTGVQNPRPVTIGKLADALGVSVEYLCGLDGPKEATQ